MNPPAIWRVARRLIQKYTPTRMNNGNNPPTMLQKLVELAVPFTQLTTIDSRGDVSNRMGANLLFNERVQRYLPPRGLASHFTQMLAELEAPATGPKTDLGATFHELAEQIKRRGTYRPHASRERSTDRTG